MDKQEKGKFEREWKDTFDGAELVPSESVWNSIVSRMEGDNSIAGFERGWKNVFKNAELNPSDEVWKAIDVSLVQSENTGMRKRILVYQRIAAASVGVMIMFGAYSWFGSGNKENLTSTNSKAVQESGIASTDSESPISSDSSNQKENTFQNPDGNMAEEAKGNLTNINQPKSNSIANTKIEESPTQSISNQTNKYDKSSSLLTENNVYSSNKESNNPVNSKRTYQFIQGPISEPNLMIVSSLPDFFGPNDYSIAYRLADARPALITKKKPDEINENSWAALSFSAGTFSPGVGGNEMVENSRSNSFSSGFSALKANDANVSKSENVKSGTSMAMAISAGKRIFKRFILQGGVSYLNQSSTSESEIVLVAPANQIYSTASFKPETTNSVTYGTQQEINSTFQFISIPLQVGYMVVDRKFGVQLNGGVSPDFFLKNSVFNETTQTETTNSAGEDEAFNVVSLSGLGSIEFSYKFLNHYRISLAPGIRYSLTPVYNENTLASAKPFVADIGLRFRYIF